jgi:hypothetical protein
MHSRIRKAIAKALLSGGVAVAGLGLSTGMAHADPSFVPMRGPLPAGNPWTWCPGDLMSGTNGRNNHGGPGLDVQWDMTRCHTWWGVFWGHGNVAPGVWDGPDPPPPEALQKPPCGFPFMCSPNTVIGLRH